jgi:hypothetical protein
VYGPEITTCPYKGLLQKLVMLCYGSPVTQVPACSAKVSSWLKPLLHLVDQNTSCTFPHTSEQDSQPTASLISKQAIPYRTRGGTYCPKVSTPKTQSLADLSMPTHYTWWNPTVSTIPILAQTDGWKTKTLNNNTSRTQHHKDGKTCMTLMTIWLSITNQVWTQILKYES